MTPAPLTVRRRQQSGLAALAVALILLFGMTLVAFFANRSFIFEQRTSANQYRSTKAFEVAEAGVEWAIGRLNEQLTLTAAPSCVPSTATTASFRDRFIAPSAPNATNPTAYFAVNNAVFPGCRLDAAGTATCACPGAGAAALGNVDEPRFRVQFNTVAADPLAVEVVSRGCTNGDPCDPTQAATASDSTAIVRVIVKVVPAFPSGPAAALTTGSAAVAGGNLSVINTHAPSNGITIHSGTSVALGSGTNVTTIAGTPPRASVLDGDPTLAALTTADANGDTFFSAFFGQTLTNYANDTGEVIRITGCGNATSCGSAVIAAMAGKRNPRFYLDVDVSFTNGNVPGSVLGSPTNPVTIVTTGNLEFKSNLTAYGVFYAATATASENWDYDGSGSGTIFGAFISRGNFDKGSGTLNLVYDPTLWGGNAPPNGKLARVPGSWRDKSTDY